MATFLKTTSAGNLVTLDPVQGLVDYVLDIKPYHTKIVDVLIEYIHTDAVNATITEKFNLDMYFTRPDSTVEYVCGYGSVYDSTPGYQVVNVHGTKTGASLTGLANDATVYTASVMVDGDISSIPFTKSGYQIVNVGGLKTGASATGLTNDATGYTATITIDGGAPIILSITGSTAQTYAQLFSLMDSFLVLEPSAIAVLESGNIKIISSSTGTTSTVSIVDSGANHLFASLTGYVSIDAAVAGVAIVGSAAQTYSTLVALLNIVLSPNASAALVGGNIQITSATTGSTSEVIITDTNLFSSLTDFIGFEATVFGTPGYDQITCPLAAAPDLYVAATFTEKLVIDLGFISELNFSDSIGVTMLENQPYGYSDLPFDYAYDELLGPSLSVVTTGDPVIGAWDVPRLDVGGFDEDLTTIMVETP